MTLFARDRFGEKKMHLIGAQKRWFVPCKVECWIYIQYTMRFLEDTASLKRVIIENEVPF